VEVRNSKAIWLPSILQKKVCPEWRTKELKEFNELQREQYVQKALSELKLKEDDISSSPYSICWKRAMASHLKRNSSVPNAWLSERLNMGVPNAVSNNCGWYQREAESRCKIARRLNNMKYER
jgi:hypothetical protein